MSQLDVLRERIESTNSIIQECEDILRLSQNPKEKSRTRRLLGEQKALIERYTEEYTRLAAALQMPIPKEINAHLDQKLKPELQINSITSELQPDNKAPIRDIWEQLTRFLAVQLVATSLAILGLAETITGYYGLDKCGRRLWLLVLLAGCGALVAGYGTFGDRKRLFSKFDRLATLGIWLFMVAAFGLDAYAYCT